MAGETEGGGGTEEGKERQGIRPYANDANYWLRH